MSTAILWFRNDLRLHDNEALYHACESGKRILPVFVLPSRELEITSLGISKMGIRRLRFLLQSLEELQMKLLKMGLPLQFRIGRPHEELLRLANEYKAHEIFLHSEAATEEAEDERLLEQAGLSLHSYVGQSLLHPHDLPFPLEKLPKHFTPFRHQVEAHWKVRPEFPIPNYKGSKWTLQPTALPRAKDLLPHQNETTENAFYLGGEKGALARLHYYLTESQLVSKYKETRNGLLGSDYSSRLSAWLALGCLSPRRVYHELKVYEVLHGANENTYWLMFELLWRDYFRFSAMKAGASFFRMKRHENLTPNTTLRKWCDGKTPHPFANACMNELRETGYLSNRGRQNAASFLIHDLKQDWSLGAQYFEHHLIDYDVYSNYGNWTYLAGVGADPRKDRKFNLTRQAEMYDPDSDYQRQWA